MQARSEQTDGVKGEWKEDREKSALLTRHLKEVRTIQELLRTHFAHEQDFKDFHLSRCWSHFGGLLRRCTDRYWLHMNPGMLEPLVNHTVRALGMGEVGASSLAKIAGGVAETNHSGRGKLFGSMSAALARASERRMDDFSVKDLATTAWSFAEVSQSDVPLFVTLARRGELLVHDFQAPSLASMAWAFVTSSTSDALLFAALAREAKQRASESNVQDIVNAAWAFSTANQSDAYLSLALARAAERHIGAMNGHDFAKIATTFAKAGQLDAPLLGAFAREVKRRVGDFKRLALVNIAEAFETAGLPDAQVFTSLVRATEAWESERLKCLQAAMTLIGSPGELTWMSTYDQKIREVGSGRPDGIPPRPCLEVPWTWQFLGGEAVHKVPEDFSLRAKNAISSAPGSKRLMGTKCYLEYGLSWRDTHASSHGSILKSGQSRQRTANQINGSEAHPDQNEEAQSPLLAVEIGHDRSSDAEFQALRVVLQRAQQLVGNVSGLDEVHGQASLHVTDIPCLSCMGAFAQFRRWLPHVCLHLSFAVSPFTSGGRTTKKYERNKLRRIERTWAMSSNVTADCERQ